MKEKVNDIIEIRKENLQERLEKNYEAATRPMFSSKTIEYDMMEKISAIHCGGIGLIDQMVKKIELPDLINAKLSLLKRHKPYYESDHVLNMMYNIVCGGEYLEDIELLRANLSYMDALGAERIPDPTTAGDFLRRFGEEDILTLMEINNETNIRVMRNALKKKDRAYGIIDVDGKIQETYGECKEGMDMSYKGIWGFSTLIITESTTGTHLYVVNRPGNALSQEGAAKWIDKSIDHTEKVFDRVFLRGDSAFSLTAKFDEWDGREVDFIFGYDAMPNLIGKADLLGKDAWKLLTKNDRSEGNTDARRKKPEVKKEKIIQREYETKTQREAYVSEFSYKPGKCDKEYRIIAVKKIIDVTKGQQYLFEDARYFFYITNIEDMTPDELVDFIHKRCNHENKIEQMDNGINALKMPAAEFLANWTYMVIVSMAWNLKSWLGLFMNDKAAGKKIINCEYKSFQNKIINIPCQIIKTGRHIVYRLLNYHPWIEIILATFDRIKGMRLSFA